MLVAGKELADLARDVLVDPDLRLPATATSVPLHLDDQFLVYDPPPHPVVPPVDLPTRPVPLDAEGIVVLKPGDAVLACTKERIDMPLGLFGLIQTKGQLARGFLTAHLCDGQVDPGFAGKLTLELVNLGPIILALRPGMPIANLYLWEVGGSLEHGYDGRFQGADGPTSMAGLPRQGRVGRLPDERLP